MQDYKQYIAAAVLLPVAVTVHIVVVAAADNHVENNPPELDIDLDFDIVG